MLNQLKVFFFFLGLPLYALATDYAWELDQRYAPYADWEALPGIGLIEAAADSSEAEAWWRRPETIRRSRSESDPPLSGLHLALDPGHIGGEWASIEGRDFRISPDDHPIREGELALEVARIVQTELVKRGAVISLLREKNRPLNPKPPAAYYASAAERVAAPAEVSWASLFDYGLALRAEMNHMAVIAGELAERARIVNAAVRPDALISLHINAAPWPVDEEGHVQYTLVNSNHSHVLIFGCLSDAELSRPLQREQLIQKLTNGSGPVERELGEALGSSIGAFSGLPPSFYSGGNAVRLDDHTPYLWARNLMLLRYVECPTVLLEPYIANSRGTYRRLQEALENRKAGRGPAEDDILIEYANAVVRGVLAVYGSESN